ncbi:hypothetical protein ANCDUO_17174 [Ancylostoma duodenale]|uniref:7TM GPCR serpentine receptor class x (Srx) domain-containing protein n=1 Tax=Ancylostoma duodenale TaxID=51022 RepID=A0A0C2CSF1_9BILA|nr:hypothetical protein ANCDUO_26691 [Ancylostoma duodenale]KIH52722.1 hypothetical protein ANCDUO_17174 [Ancylostoma duodenale]
MDVVAGIRLHMVLKAAARNMLSSGKERLKRDVRFFLQTMSNTLVFSLTVLSFHVISTHMTTKISMFISTTLVWGINHAAAG